jgi:MoaA/NifB/PqqE/SkfB family radical SAM enzyme
LDENLFPLLEYISSQGLSVKVYTNGSLINDTLAEQLYGLGVSVMLKIHSLDPAIFDELAGRVNAVEWSPIPAKWGGTNVPAALKSLLEAGYYKTGIDGIIESKLQIESVVVRQNLNCIPVIARLCRQLHIDYHVETMIPPPGSPENAEKLTVTPGEEYRLFRELRSILGLRFRMQQKVRCRYETNPFIDISGNLRHCFSVEASIGNIRDTSLAELHRLELEERRAKGMISPKISLSHYGFRDCASRRVLKKEKRVCP